MRNLVVFGLGELGKLYGAGALAAGIRVRPVLRNTAWNDLWTELPAHTPLLIAVSEPSLPTVLNQLPEGRRGDAILLQNEIFPSLWSRADLEPPTVLIPWLLKKPGLPVMLLRTTPVFGRHARLVAELHQALGFDCEILTDENDLARELAHKYAFILTINALGVWKQYGTLGDWLAQEEESVRAIASEAAVLAAHLAGVPVDVDRSLHTVLPAMHTMSAVRPQGRSAAARVLRAQGEARRLGLKLPVLETLEVGV